MSLPMPRSTRRIAPIFVLAAVTVTALGLATPPAQAQCLSETECDSLKAQLGDFKDEFRSLKEQRKALRVEFKNAAAGSPERAALKEKARALRQEARQLRERARPVRRSHREGCRNC